MGVYHLALLAGTRPSKARFGGSLRVTTTPAAYVAKSTLPPPQRLLNYRGGWV